MKRGLLVIISSVLFIIGVLFLINSRTITGNVVSESVGETRGFILGIIFIIGGIVLFTLKLEHKLEKRLEDEPLRGKREQVETIIGRTKEGREGLQLSRAQKRLPYNWRDKAGELIYNLEPSPANEESYRQLAKIFGKIEEDKLIGVPPEMPKGRYISREEENYIKDILMKYIPKELIEKNSVVALGGSLSRVGKGNRTSKLGIKGLKSDEFWLSDVDIGIGSKELFDSMVGNWESVIVPKGKGVGGSGSEKETFKITDLKYLTTDERGLGYMGEAPDWIKKMVKELHSHPYAGEYRPVNIKIYSSPNKINAIPKDVLYRKI